jgi:hypothetical protein
MFLNDCNNSELQQFIFLDRLKMDPYCVRTIITGIEKGRIDSEEP